MDRNIYYPLPRDERICFLDKIRRQLVAMQINNPSYDECMHKLNNTLILMAAAVVNDNYQLLHEIYQNNIDEILNLRNLSLNDWLEEISAWIGPKPWSIGGKIQPI